MQKSTEIQKKCKCESNYYEKIDIFGIGDLTDCHMDVDLSEEEMAERFHTISETAKRMGGVVGSGVLEELGALMAPKMTWEDFAAISIGSKKEGVGKNDWGSPRSRPLFYGQYLPKKRLNVFKLLMLVDRSGSVSNEQTVYGISQFQALGHSVEGYVVCFDVIPYYDQATYIENGTAEELIKIPLAGGGGTLLASSLYSYEKELGPVDMVAIITDGGIFDIAEINKRGSPNTATQFLWLLTERNVNFIPSFGRVFRLNNET